MNFQRHILFAGISLLCACNEQQKSTEQSTTSHQTETAPAPADTSATLPKAGWDECYGSKQGNSIVELSLRMNDGLVVGNLNYLPEAKDKNTGSINGKMRGDTLMADYTFMSEGVQSVREVIFLKTADGFKEGYGPVKDQNGKMVFEDLKAIDFSKSVPLQKIDCNKGIM
ncbi:MAG: hypothetical protein EOO03_06840 [Chitinophagaceae bacterium]|nr:MAG: hypothetical protein EOO03_06840 [Chitinophagaceae bacterium]